MNTHGEIKQESLKIPLLNKDESDYDSNSSRGASRMRIEVEDAPKKQDKKKNSHESAGLFNRLHFYWIYPMIKV